MSVEILICPHNHFDPTWRRCFDRPARRHGLTVRSYAEVEELCFNRWLELAERGYTFSEGQACVLRKYLQRNPDKKPLLQKYAANGQFNVMLAGEVVQDSNLPTAEGLVRNFLVAMPLYAELVGLDHPALKLAWLEDAFGNNPNMPQILRGVGAEAACMLSYRPAKHPIWVGIDGSWIYCPDPIGRTVGVYGFEKHAPCPDCRGEGCATCRDTGLTINKGYDPAAFDKALHDAQAHPSPWVQLWIGTEELLPDEQAIAWRDEVNRSLAGQVKVEFSNISDIYERLRPELEQAARAERPPVFDANPAMQGCYVSRIRTKQRTRQVSYELIAAESALANAAWQAGAPAAQPPELTEAWRKVAFNQFHDAITGTHIDSAFDELMDLLDDAQAIARKRTPAEAAQAAPPGEGRDAWRIVHGASSGTLGRLKVEFDRIGISSVLCEGQDVFGLCKANHSMRRPWRIGELTIENDFGDAWGKRIANKPPHQEPSVIGLGDYNQSVEVAENAIRWQGEYTGGDPKIKRLAWTVTVRPSADGRRLDFTTDVIWDTESRRLSVIVPVKSQDDSAVYEVPYGFIERRYDPTLDAGKWLTNEMTWPTLHWAARRIDERRGVAVLNRGLPCYRWMPGRMEISLLRSPEWMFCVVEHNSYEFYDITGQKDAGRHRLEYSLLPFVDGMGYGEITRAGYEYNMPSPIRLPFELSGDVNVTAWKLAEDGSGWILRLHDASGQGSDVRLEFDRPRHVTATNLLEQPTGDAVQVKTFTSPLHKHGILTLLIQP